MKRYVCTVAVGLLLALVGTGTATAGLEPIPTGDSQEGTQSILFGEQTIGEQENDADVTQAQGNGNLNIAPAISVFGDASTWNAQGNDNTAVAVVDQSNTASQSQAAEQEQSLTQDGSGSSCCQSSDQTAEQYVEGGDQTIGEQKNDADVEQYQGNGNINVAPAISVFGDASTSNSQGNGNTAVAVVDQSNSATQSQWTSQTQNLDRSGGSCCGGQSQTGEQYVEGGDQTIGKQKNDADVEQYQGNGNINVAPAISVFGDASTWNSQGNGNKAVAVVVQSNDATQSQRASQTQNLTQSGGSCCGGQSQTGEQKTAFGDQTIDKQKNEADVTQKQGNGNFNFAPAASLFGDASTWNAQGNGNTAIAIVGQSNSARQSQSASQTQNLSQQGGCCESPQDCKDFYGCKPKDGYEKDDGYRTKSRCCDGSSQTGEQHVYGGDQTIEKQKNDADVSQYQGNGNENIAPAFGFPVHHKGDSCSKERYGTCDRGGKYVPLGGNASTWNAQGNGNTAVAYVGQSNSATQSQWVSQTQTLVQDCYGEVTRS
jgi:hypothetical protein